MEDGKVMRNPTKDCGFEAVKVLLLACRTAIRIV